MADFTIYLGNKNYSSWSLRPWLVLKQTGVPFDEIVIPLYEATSKATIMKYSPSGTVPALKHGELVVWDSLPINIRSTFPNRGVTPEVQAEINRVMAIWRDCRKRFGEGKGEFLFGNFSIADATYAPVITRFRTYKIDLEREAQVYCEKILALPAMQEWIAAARN